jgi:hypothetical protein
VTVSEDAERIAVLHRTLAAALDIKKHNKLSAVRPLCQAAGVLRARGDPRERMFNAGNQLGKSDAGAYETACHVTGIYPSWWTGLRFDRPILAWACGLTADKTMGINQLKLCGKPNTPDTWGRG